MKHVKLFEQFINEDLNEALDPRMAAVVKKPGERWLDWNTGVTKNSLFATIRKSATEFGKKAMQGAYMDDNDIVHQKSGKTIHTIKNGEPIAAIIAGVNKWAEANAEMFAPKSKSIADSEQIEIKSDTRAILSLAVDSNQGEAIRKQLHDSKAGIKARLMDRKGGVKIYIDTDNKESLDAALAKAKSIIGG